VHGRKGIVVAGGVELANESEWLLCHV